MLSENLKKEYDKGYITDKCIYDNCDTDFEVYLFYKEHCKYSEDEIKAVMLKLSDCLDGYNDARFEYLCNLYDEFFDETSDVYGDVDNSRFSAWLKEKNQEYETDEIQCFIED